MFRSALRGVLPFFGGGRKYGACQKMEIKNRKSRLKPWFAAMALSIAAGATPALEESFAHPPAENRPETYFFMFGGNISAEGITADLEAIKAGGFAGVRLFHGSSPLGAWPGVANQVRCLSDGWEKLVGHFGREAKRLGLKFTMHVCPGWAMAGGPWIEPASSMRHLSFRRTDIEGGRLVKTRLERGEGDDWRDVAVLAFPAPEGDWVQALSPASVTANVEGDWENWRLGRGKVSLPADSTTEIVFDFDEPATVRTLELPAVRSLANVTKCFGPDVSIRLDSSAGEVVENLALPPSGWQDERTFSVACRETTAKRFVLTVKNGHAISLGTVRLLSAAKKDNYEAEAGWTLRRLLDRPSPPQDERAWIPAGSITNVTAMMAKDGLFEWNAPAGRWAVLRIGHVSTGEKNAPAPDEGTGLECDKFSAAAADIQFDSYIGRLSAPGRPAAGTIDAMCMDSWECRQQTWTPGLNAAFLSRFGYDLFSFLPAVFGYVVSSPGDTARFLDDYRSLASDMIVENFYGRMAARARWAGMGIDFETSFGTAIAGDILKYWKYADVPMCEFWQPAVSPDFTPVKPAVSAARVYGKRRVSAEAFTAFRVSWNEKLRDYKHNANMNLAEGISHFVFHTYTHNPQTPFLPPGSSFSGQHNIGSPFVRGQTWWRNMPSFTDYFARCQTMLEAGRPVADVLWYLGDELDGRPDHSAPFPQGFKYDYCNADAFLSRIDVNERGEWQTPEGVSWRVLYLPSCRRMLPETMKHLAAGVKKGALAVMARLPDEPATLKGGAGGEADFRAARSELERLAREGALHVGGSLEDVLGAPDLRVASGGAVAWNHRRADGLDWYFVAPAEDGKGFDGTIDFRSRGGVEIWHPENGSIEPVDSSTVQPFNRSTVHLSLAPAQACFVVFKPFNRSTVQHFNRSTVQPSTCPIAGPWRLSFPDGRKMTLAELKPWKDLGATPEEKAFSGTAVYETEFDLGGLAPGERVILDLGRVESVARVTLNGRTFPDVWAAPCRVDVSAAARNGANKLAVEVTDTWFNRLQYDAQIPEEKRRTWTFFRPGADLPLVPSGLLGPVAVERVRAEPAAVVRLVEGAKAMEPSPMIFGHFIEHFDNQVYGGIFDPASPLADEDGFRKDVIEALREIKCPVVRWPGGCFVSAYHWKDGIGENRRPAWDKAWRVEDPNTFGTDEFVKWCRKVGCEPYICTNAGTGAPEEMGDWVEYCNLPCGEWGRRRIKNGFAEPHGVKYWSIGNENWGRHEIGMKTIAEWGPFVRESAKIMRAADPSIYLFAAATPDEKWTLPLLENAGSLLDFISIHEYYDFLLRKDEPAGFLACMMKTRKPEKTICDAIALLEKAGFGNGKIGIAFDEWNLRSWHHPGCGDYSRGGVMDIPARRRNDRAATYTMADALFSACFLNACLRHSDVVKMANFSPVVNTRGILSVHPGGIVKRTTWHVFRMYANLLEAKISPVAVDCPALSDGETSVPVLDAVLSVSADGSRRVLAVVNKHPDEEQTLDLGPLAPQGASVEAVVLSGETPDDFNDEANPGRVAPREMDLELDGAAVKLPAHSLAFIYLQGSRP